MFGKKMDYDVNFTRGGQKLVCPTSATIFAAKTKEKGQETLLGFPARCKEPETPPKKKLKSASCAHMGRKDMDGAF